MILLLVYILLALGLSFLCSLLEASLLSIPFGYIALLNEQGKKYGQILWKQKENISRPLAAILTLNTIAHTVGAVGVGAQVSILFGNKWVASASAILTLLILFLSEIIPKTLGARYCRELGKLTALVVRALVVITYPVILVIEALPKKLSNIRQNIITREELGAFSRIAAQYGSLSLDEVSVIRNLLALKNIYIHQIMTPICAVFSLPAEMIINNAVKRHKVIPFSRIPIYDGSEENIIGVVLRIKMLIAYQEGRGDDKLQTLIQSVHKIDEEVDIAQLLKEFFLRRQHLFVVTKKNQVVGIVTLEDAIESLLGVEIVDETDAVVDMRELAVRIKQKNKK